MDVNIFSGCHYFQWISLFSVHANAAMKEETLLETKTALHGNQPGDYTLKHFYHKPQDVSQSSNNLLSWLSICPNAGIVATVSMGLGCGWIATRAVAASSVVQSHHHRHHHLEHQQHLEHQWHRHQQPLEHDCNYAPLSMASNLHHHVISIWSKQMVEEHFCMWPTDFSACVAFSLFCLCAFSTAIIMAGSHWPTVQTVCSCFSLELKSWQVSELRLSGQQHEQYSGEASKFYCMRKRPIKWLTIEAISKSSDLKDQKWLHHSFILIFNLQVTLSLVAKNLFWDIVLQLPYVHPWFVYFAAWEKTSTCFCLQPR